MTDIAIHEELQLLRDSARSFIQKESPVSALRKLRDNRDETGFSRQLWQEMAELGWVGMTIPEQYDGMGYGYIGWGPILEEMGRGLVASPYFSTAVLGATAVQLSGRDEQKESILPEVASGERLLAFALEEGDHHAPESTALEATRTDSGYVLSGRKRFVQDGHVADHLIVTARTSGQPGDRRGLSLFLVDAAAADIEIDRTIMVDTRNAADIAFNEVEVSSASLLGTADEGAEILEKVLNIGRIALATEMLGVAQEAFDRTINYLKTRQQFGVYIGSFQGLQHRASQMFCELETSKSVVQKALQAIDDDTPHLAQMASLAKYTLGETTQLVTREAIQMFGGIGMTDEEEIGFFIKRAIVAEKTLGDHAYHLNRYASLQGY
ncbi:acyl-CoA dehydrogenase [Chloroflexi bacterium TSY]|nr:acyl-CoA dehydrogenase [Chloroflexi bacterium TSY]